MFDLITLVSTMGLQEELNGVNRKPTIHEGSTEDSLLGQAADSLSSAFETFEESLSQGMSSLLGTSEDEASKATSKVA
eukprot:CAMPEP_0169071900 /NCGR_PEP_ID=MMETSP1015-20121227/5901_1 /TAXON_ID=342587 /ORGANISM="Karlodinium micrum, Strain CCMP2283" /LENGTH=77 /DNA_ID=CAMNT_0009131007 /DNA_START=66 /DNA_END=299 /DNA_ORIENTATION=+